MGLSNDERGWVMTCLSGMACVLGASIICVDIVIRQLPGRRTFKIQDSDRFLSTSLSLSFGVLLFSALYSMLPSAKNSLREGGLSPKSAAWVLIACFIGGVVGIQIVSRVLHHYLPSHVVDCEHTHGSEPDKEDAEAHECHGHEDITKQIQSGVPKPIRKSSLPGRIAHDDSILNPSIQRSSSFSNHVPRFAATSESEADNNVLDSRQAHQTSRPTLHQRLTTTITQIVSGEDPSCSCDGPCYGYSDVCGQECFKNINARGGYRAPVRLSSKPSVRPSISKNSTKPPDMQAAESTPLLHQIAEEDRSLPTRDHSYLNDRHHHHVPANEFLSMGLLTSIAIALHKLPEGFITYATNHANPRLGVSVFLALFIHNITEGFAMALPLYLAINNRLQAMLISFILGGLSQPAGAGVAALWFKVAGKGNWAPSDIGYGAMFAVTAGIMTSVALQLFSESLELTHSKTLCFVGAFAGMAILGVSSALTA
ncbi:hypothetical protein M433DRAFT_57996 [Acidomyces richmondensis BFW]|nr:MAG: hypothetical protein FE78DRAFT_146102 [Acidomyces sp. 'richmondensis']KYG50035.1 hypothetical protein M433DRAFT_57996 [Acidomyces richmondensis BFW]